jgi:hypothetical protein
MSKVNQDARVLQVLKQECNQSGNGSETLSKVFTGLLSVHNRNLIDFTNALGSHRNDGGRYGDNR